MICRVAKRHKVRSIRTEYIHRRSVLTLGCGPSVCSEWRATGHGEAGHVESRLGCQGIGYRAAPCKIILKPCLSRSMILATCVETQTLQRMHLSIMPVAERRSCQASSTTGLSASCFSDPECNSISCRLITGLLSWSRVAEAAFAFQLSSVGLHTQSNRLLGTEQCQMSFSLSKCDTIHPYPCPLASATKRDETAALNPKVSKSCPCTQ